MSLNTGEEKSGYFRAGGDDSPATQIAGSEKRMLVGSWLGVALVAGVAIFFFWKFQMPFFVNGGTPNPVVGVFVLFGGALLAKAVWETVRLKRFGDPVLDLTQSPVPPGGVVEGRVVLASSISSAPPFAARLQCIRRITRNAGKNTQVTERVLWTGESTAALMPGGIVPFSIDVPADQPESNDSNPWDKILWRLTVQAPFRGIAFLEKYEIPVRGDGHSVERSAGGDGLASFAGAPSKLTPKRAWFNALLFFVVMVVPSLAFGIYLLPLAARDIEQASVSRNWPTATGQILESRAIPTRNAAEVAVLYSYTVKGSSYTGTIVCPHWFWTERSSRNMVNAFSKGRSVPVHYAPGHPDEAVLLAGLRPAVFQRALGVTLLFSLATLIGTMCLSMFRYGEISGNTITFEKGSPISKIAGPLLLLMLLQGLLLWWVS